MNNDLDLLTRVKLPDSAVDAEWGADERDRLLATVLNSPSGPRRSSRRRWAVAGLVGAAAAASVVASTVLPSGSPAGPDPAAAAALRRLAVVAGTHDVTVPAGSYLYAKVAETNPGSVRDVRSWINAAGDYWITSPDSPPCLMHLPHEDFLESGGYATASVDELGTLPLDPDALGRFIDAHRSGDLEGADNRFTAVGDLLSTSLASGELRAAALQLLARTPGLTVDTSGRDWRGRAATIVSLGHDRFADQLFFDPATSRIVEQRTIHGSTVDYQGNVVETAVVDGLPTDIPACE